MTITRNGGDPLVLLSAEVYERLKRRDRLVVKLENFIDEDMALIAKAEVPAEHAHLDTELKDWLRRAGRSQRGLVARSSYLWEREANQGPEGGSRIGRAR